MSRVQFTKLVCKLIAAMFLDNEHPLIDFVKRSDQEQMRLFLEKRSKCDGVEIKSKHQFGRAADIYFLDDDEAKMVDPKKGWEYWHEYWEKLGGKPIIEWDKVHFEV